MIPPGVSDFYQADEKNLGRPCMVGIKWENLWKNNYLKRNRCVERRILPL